MLCDADNCFQFKSFSAAAMGRNTLRNALRHRRRPSPTVGYPRRRRPVRKPGALRTRPPREGAAAPPLRVCLRPRRAVLRPCAPLRTRPPREAGASPPVRVSLRPPRAVPPPCAPLRARPPRKGGAAPPARVCLRPPRAVLPPCAPLLARRSSGADRGRHPSGRRREPDRPAPGGRGWGRAEPARSRRTSSSVSSRHSPRSRPARRSGP